MTPVVVGACEIAGAPVAPYGLFLWVLLRARARYGQKRRKTRKKNAILGNNKR